MARRWSNRSGRCRTVPGTRERVRRTRDEAIAEGVTVLSSVFRGTPGFAAFAEGVAVGIRAALLDPEHAEMVMDALVRAFGAEGAPRVVDGHAEAILVRARRTAERDAENGDWGE